MKFLQSFKISRDELSIICDTIEIICFLCDICNDVILDGLPVLLKVGFGLQRVDQEFNTLVQQIIILAHNFHFFYLIFVHSVIDL